MCAIVKAALNAPERAKKLVVGDDSKTPSLKWQRSATNRLFLHIARVSSNMFANLQKEIAFVKNFRAFVGSSVFVFVPWLCVELAKLTSHESDLLN